jgi:hypothetical protein
MAAKGWRQIAARFAAMDRREIIERSSQEIFKRADALRSRLGLDFVAAAAGAELSQPGRFFFSPAAIDSILDTLRQRLPEQVAQIKAQADKVCHHRFDLLGYENLDFGDPIDWHLDAVHGKRAPRKPFHKIRFLDFEEVGDSKITWELNRHQHFVTLAKAYRLTEESRYADEISRQWKHWHAENPYPIGINWASSLEVAFRSLSWLWMFHLLDGTAAGSADFRKEWLHAQALSGRHIERYLSTYFSPNTHLLGEGVALFFLGLFCPELSGAKRWKSLGWEIVLREAQRQVHFDGFHFEGSIYYHVYAIDFFLHSALLAELNGVAIPREFEETLQRMLHALSLLSRAGPPPRFGDDDGGRLFDGRRNRNEHLLDPLVTGAVRYHRGDFKAQADGLREETVWLLGTAGVDAFDRLQPQAPEWKSAALSHAGLYLLAASEPLAQMVISAGREMIPSSGHAHADALSLCLSQNGQSLLMDPGTFEYVGATNARDLFRSTIMHNALRVRETSQSEPSGPFSWRQLARSKVEQWIEGETFTLFCGSHDGYTQQVPAVVHRRWVVALNCGLFLIRDLAEGEGETKLNIPWHLGADLNSESHFFRKIGSSAGLTIIPASGHEWNREILRDRWSPAYGVEAPDTTLNFSALATLPAEFATLLSVHEASHPPGVLMQVSASGARVYSCKLLGEEHLFFFAQQKPWRCAVVESDASFAYCRRNSGGENDVVVFCDGSYIEINQQRVLSASKTVARGELVVGKAGVEMFCSEPDALEKQPSRPRG